MDGIAYVGMHLIEGDIIMLYLIARLSIHWKP